jgi:hypothetical protein
MSLDFSGSPVRVGIMQPYFLPHLSYFQLIANTDFFCLHDKVKYTKQSWVNRNRIIVNGKIEYLTIPIQSSSDFDLIDDKLISNTFDRKSQLRKIELNYKESPNFKDVFPIVLEILNFRNPNLFEFLRNSISQVCQYLQIETKIIKSSETNYDQNLAKSQMVIDICKMLRAETYINSQGGIELYDSTDFLDNGIVLLFAKQIDFSYSNSIGETNSSLSILDTLMWVDKNLIIEKLHEIEFMVDR